jgi:predicted nuclease with TOPRIM domain
MEGLSVPYSRIQIMRLSDYTALLERIKSLKEIAVTREAKIQDLLRKINKEYKEGTENYKMKVYWEGEYKKANLELTELRKERLRLKQQVIDLTEWKQRFGGFDNGGMQEVMSLYNQINHSVDKYNGMIENQR